jgi:hypothetical protein
MTKTPQKPRAKIVLKYTEENYKAIIEFTRNKVSEFEDKEATVETLKRIGVLNSNDSQYIIGEIIERLSDFGVLKLKTAGKQGESNFYKFTGSEAKWHLNASHLPKENYLEFNPCSTLEVFKFLTSGWAR